MFIEVRENHVRIGHDGKEQVNVEGRLPAGQVDGAFFPPAKKQPPFFGIGVCLGDITVHSAEFREVDRNGTPVGPGSAASTKPQPRK